MTTFVRTFSAWSAIAAAACEATDSMFFSSAFSDAMNATRTSPSDAFSSDASSSARDETAAVRSVTW